MAKKREFASDSDVMQFITKRQNPVAENTEKRMQFTIYPKKNLYEQVKILAKIKDKNMNDTFLELVQNSIMNEENQKIIEMYKKMF
ncbi:MAG: hypothetical protein IJP69_01745 [Synergistaceae bacterium]|nr:hypothetical protein [Synergistaceae bacterium]MBR0233141.1 hypothetical protein [Synergistaceae bacterium]